MIKIPHLRWFIIVLIFLAAVLNYVDRQTLSALAPTIQRDLRMDDRAYANVVNIFLVAYTIAYLVSGKLVDLLGTRLGTVVFVGWWSVANMLTAAAQGVQSLGAFRFLLGLGEAGVWPAASKAVAEWFPARERALAIGFYTMGATIGARLHPTSSSRSPPAPVGNNIPGSLSGSGRARVGAWPFSSPALPVLPGSCPGGCSTGCRAKANW